MAKEVTGEKKEARYLQFYEEIVAARSAFKSKYQKEIKIEDELTRKRTKEGKHLLDIEKMKIDEKLLNELSQDFFPIFREYETCDDVKLPDLERKKGEIGLGNLVRSILGGDLESPKSLALKLNLNTDSLLFFGLNLGQTFLELYALELKGRIDQENWLKGNCPVCGSLPAMEKLRREDGRRILWCGLCGTEWYFKRIMCPFCGNEDHNSLRYFFIEEEVTPDKTAFRVDVCDRCKRYIKTLDERKLPESEKPDLQVENLNTVYLDVLAQKDGYKSPTFWMITLSEEALA